MIGTGAYVWDGKQWRATVKGLAEPKNEGIKFIGRYIEGVEVAPAGDFEISFSNIAPPPAVGDTVILIFNASLNPGPWSSIPDGWVLRDLWNPTGNRSLRILWKRVSFEDIGGKFVFTTPGHNYTYCLTAWRGLDPLDPIGNIGKLYASGHSSDVTVDVERDGSHAMHVFSDWSANWGNPNWADSAPSIKIGYSSNIRDAAAIGVRRIGPLPLGSATAGVPSFGTSNSRVLMVLQPPEE